MKEKIYARFCALQAAYWAFMAVLMGYMTSYMLYKGMTSTQIGLAIAGNLLAAFLGSIFWGQRIDREQANRKYFLFGLLINLIAGLLLWSCAGSPVLSLFFYTVFGFVNGFMATNLDAWVMVTFPEKKQAVGQSRSFATLTYAFMMLIFGAVIRRVGYFVMPIAASAFLGCCFLLARLQPETPKVQRIGEEKRNVREDMVQLAGNHRYVFLLVVLFLTGMTVAPLDRMKPLIFERIGGGVDVLGLDAFIGCMIQYPFLAFSGKLRKIPQNTRMQAGILLPFFYALCVMLARTPAMVIIGTIFHQMSFGILFSTYREMTEECVDHRLRNTAHSLIDASYGSVSGMFAMTYTGVVIGSAGTAVMAMICMGVQLTAILIGAFCFRTGGMGHVRRHGLHKA